MILELRLAFELYRVLKPGGTLAVWTLSPFWSPRVLIKHAPFGSAGCARKVHRLMKRDRYRFVILINRSRGTAYGHIKGELADGITCHMRESVSREAVNDDYVLHLIAANLIEGILKAANSPENAAGIVLEDPPLFSGEGERALQTFARIDSFTPAHDFLNQNAIRDYSPYYIEHCRWIQFFGNAGEKIIDAAGRYRESHEGLLKFPLRYPRPLYVYFGASLSIR